MKVLEVEQEPQAAQSMIMSAYMANQSVKHLAAEGIEHDVYPISGTLTLKRKNGVA